MKKFLVTFLGVVIMTMIGLTSSGFPSQEDLGTNVMNEYVYAVQDQVLHISVMTIPDVNQVVTVLAIGVEGEFSPGDITCSTTIENSLRQYLNSYDMVINTALMRTNSKLDNSNAMIALYEDIFTTNKRICDNIYSGSNLIVPRSGGDIV